MANGVYTPGMQHLLAADLDLDNVAFNVKVVGTDHTDVTPTLATHDALNDISAGTVATSGNLANKTVTGGVFDADDTSLSGTGGDGIDSITVYYDSGTAATSWLICYFDTATGLPYTPPAGSWTLNIQWDSGTNRIFKIG